MEETFWCNNLPHRSAWQKSRREGSGRCYLIRKYLQRIFISSLPSQMCVFLHFWLYCSYVALNIFSLIIFDEILLRVKKIIYGNRFFDPWNFAILKGLIINFLKLNQSPKIMLRKFFRAVSQKLSFRPAKVNILCQICPKYLFRRKKGLFFEKNGIICISPVCGPKPMVKL